MRKTFKLLLSIIFFVALISSCQSGLNRIEATSLKLESVTPTGLSSLRGTVRIGVNNPAGRIGLENVVCLVKLDTAGFFQVHIDDFSLAPKCDSVYTVGFTGVIVKKLNVLQLLSGGLQSISADRLRADVHAKIRVNNGVGTTLSYKDVPLARLIKENR